MRNGPFDGSTESSRTFIRNAVASGSLTPPPGGLGDSPVGAVVRVVGCTVLLIAGIAAAFVYGMTTR
jgi:hypothetical protein